MFFKDALKADTKQKRLSDHSRIFHISYGKLFSKLFDKKNYQLIIFFYDNASIDPQSIFFLGKNVLI